MCREEREEGEGVDWMRGSSIMFPLQSISHDVQLKYMIILRHLYFKVRNLRAYENHNLLYHIHPHPPTHTRTNTYF